MKKLLLLLSAALLLERASASVCVEPFADATASGGTSYAVGGFLFGQVNSFGNAWFALTNTPAPPATGFPVLVAGSLAYPGLPASSGNSVSIPSGTGVMGRLTLNFTTTTGAVYYSFLLKVTDLSAVDASGTQNNFFAGFGDTFGSQNATLLRAATRVYTRRAGTGFNLGVARNSSSASDWVFESTQRNINDVLLVVGSYNYDNHTANLWVNPAASSFGTATAPAPTLTATGGSDLNSNGIRAFVLGCRTNAPPACLVDELRVGSSWALVTGGLTITTQPASQTLDAGTTGRFTVEATGDSSLSYQWRRNGTNLTEGGHVLGVNTASLSLSNLLQADAGSYSVKLTAASGSLTSSVATLTVNDPAILTQPLGQALPAGSTAKLQVTAAGTGPLTYQWYKSGSPLADDGRITGATTANLRLQGLSSSDVGSYCVTVINGLGHGVLSSNAVLYTTEPSIAALRPNIVFILCDDLGYGDLGVLYQNSRGLGLPKEATPNLDRLASEGIQLRQHYCPAPVCAPSRASLLLGVHQGHANVRDDQFEKELANNHTLATVLKTAGYSTACIGKWGLKGDGDSPATWTSWPTKRGFDYYFGSLRHGDGHEHYPKEAVYSNGSKELYDSTNNISPVCDKCFTTDLFTARAKRWITDQTTNHSGQPFFLYLAYDTPHAVYELPTQAYPAGGGTNGGMQWLGTPGHLINTASGTVDSFFHPDYAAATYDDDNNPGTPQVAWPEVFKRFATAERRLDDAVGDLKQLLQDLGIETNTLVVFTSDNGPTIEDYLSLTPRYAANFFDNFGPLDGVKRDTWEGGIRMPTLVRWPGRIPAGLISQTPSQFHDWMPTFTELCGLPAPARTDGVSLMPTLTGTGTQRSSTIYVEYFYSGATPNYAEFEPSHRGRTINQMQVVRVNGLQGVRYNIASHADDFEIYDVTHDAKETTNLATNPSYAALQQQMKDRVLQLRRPDASAPRPYDYELVPPAPALAVTNGLLSYAAYEGVWPWVPDVATLTAVSTGRVAGLDLAARTRDTNYALEFTGFLRIPEDGNYTFYLSDDAGAVFRLHDATVIDDDFPHTNGEVSASILLKAGRHPLRLTYRHLSGTNLLKLSYSGPNLAKQPVPPSAFDAACASCPVTPLAADDSAVTPANTPVTINVLANDADDGQPSPLALVSVAPPLAGTAQIISGQVRYTPNAGFLGEDTFTYTITDGAAQSTATIRVQVCYVDGSYWFPFNEVSGLTTTEAGGSISAQLQGFSNDPDQWVPGRYNKALSFDGIDNVVSIAGFNGFTGTAARTCAAWLKTTAANTMAVMSWGPNTTGNKWTLLVQSGNPRLEITGGWVQGSRLVNDGQWHHVACTFQSDGSPDATDVKLYVDGTLESALSSQASQALNTTSSGPVLIGSDVQNRYFNGVIDEVHIYNRALSAAEVATLFNATNQSAAAWQRRYLGSAATDWSADDDGDGMSRLGEYAFGGQPLLADPEVRQVMPEIVADHLQVRYNRRLTGTHELVYSCQSSPDLKNWTTLAGNEISVTPSTLLPGFEEVVFRAQPAVSAQSPLFLRLAVRLP